MALSIKTEKADRLARTIAGRTGETMTEAVERALEERWERLQQEETPKQYIDRVTALVEEIRKDFDFSQPITKQEFDEL